MNDIDNSHWEGTQEGHLKKYVKFFPRTGNFIARYFKEIESCIEIGCFSARDSRFLIEKTPGLRAVGFDREKSIVDELNNLYPGKNISYVQGDAFSLPFKDNEFDVVFHNGLLGYFDDSEIEKLLAEHIRVAKKYVITFNHNAANQKLQNVFSEKAKNDPVFGLRFFEPNYINNLINPLDYGIKKVEVLKFGHRYDTFLRKKIKGIPNPFVNLFAKELPFSYQSKPWSKIERSVTIFYL